MTASADGEGTIDVGTYASDPVVELGDASSFFDVATSPHSSFTTITFKICGVTAGASIQWYDPATASWQSVSNQSTPNGTPLCVTVTVTGSTSPSLSELYGTVFAVVSPPGGWHDRQAETTGGASTGGGTTGGTTGGGTTGGGTTGGATTGAGTTGATTGPGTTGTGTQGVLGATATNAATPVVCSLQAASTVIRVSKNAKRGRPTLTLIAKCDQAVAGTLKGVVTERLGKGKKVFKLAPVHMSLVAGTSKTLAIKFPASALAALKHGGKESAAFTLGAMNANGTRSFSAVISHLKR